MAEAVIVMFYQSQETSGSATSLLDLCLQQHKTEIHWLVLWNSLGFGVEAGHIPLLLPPSGTW